MCHYRTAVVVAVGTRDIMACAQVEDLVLSELEKLKNGGFSSTAVEAALNSIEFDLRENNTGSFPRGLSLMLRSMSSWIYDKDPFQPLQWTDSLEHFKVLSCLSPVPSRYCLAFRLSYQAGPWFS